MVTAKPKKKSSSLLKDEKEVRKNATTKGSRTSVSENQNNSVDFSLVLGVINTVLIVVVIGILLMGSNQTMGGSQSAEINSISKKVNALDSFFTNNIPEYVPDGDYGNDGGSAYGNDETPSNPQNLEVDIEGEPFKGDENAPVTIVEFSDYECPFCGRFYSQTLPLLEEEYIDTGKVKFVFKDFPLGFHQMAEPASVAANCVHKELGNDKYWQMHDLIFDEIVARTPLTQDLLNSFAKEVGVNEEMYTMCIEDDEMKKEVQADFKEGSALGVSGTPSFIIEGELIVGAQPFSVIQEVIERKLAEN